MKNQGSGDQESRIRVVMMAEEGATFNSCTNTSRKKGVSADVLMEVRSAYHVIQKRRLLGKQQKRILAFSPSLPPHLHVHFNLFRPILSIDSFILSVFVRTNNARFPFLSFDGEMGIFSYK